MVLKFASWPLVCGMRALPGQFAKSNAFLGESQRLYTRPISGSEGLLTTSLLRRNYVSATKLCGNVHSDNLNQTDLDKLIRDNIQATGPIPVSTYMQLCTSHPTLGYYMNAANSVFGERGDFITSPEISQIFGELIAIWHLSRWISTGKPRKIRIVELGPGRGTLMNDVLHTFGQFADCMAAITSVSLVETSPIMRKHQERILERYRSPQNTLSDRFFWYDSLEDVLSNNASLDSEVFTMVIAHEFFDALPIHILDKCDDGWHELYVTQGTDPAEKEVIKQVDQGSLLRPLRLVRSQEPSAPAMLLGSSSPRFRSLPVGSRIEVSPASFKIARQIAELINNPDSGGGSALIVDYGDAKVFGNSIRAFKKHKHANIFETPGLCDLTANVDFSYLREAIAKEAQVHGPITQQTFLQRMGIGARTSLLSQKLGSDEEKRMQIQGAVRRLLDPGQMGTQYKFMGVTGHGSRQADSEEVWPFIVDVKA